MINTSSWRVVLEKIRRDDLGGVSGDLVWRGEESLGVEAIGDDHRLHFLAVDDQVEDLRKKLTFPQLSKPIISTRVSRNTITLPHQIFFGDLG